MQLIGLAVILTVSLTLAPLAAGAQQPGKVYRVGVLMNLYPPDADPPQALRQGLRDLGYVEGQNETLARIFDLIAEPNRATIAQRPHKTRLSGAAR